MIGPCTIGVDVGGTKILAGVVTGDGEIVNRCWVETPVGSTEALLAALDAAVEAVLDPRVVAIGFGVPSRIDKAAGRIVGSVNIPLDGVDFRDRMEERWGMPCALDNDANAATIAEWKAGAGRGTTELAMLTLGTGVGGGLIIDGRPYNGTTGAAAELGHIVIEYGGRACRGSCRGRGHLEAYCSGSAATALAEEALGPAVDSHELIRLADGGDDVALGILYQIGCRLGAAVGTLANMFNVERVVIGGGFGTAAWPHLVHAANQVAAREALEPGRSIVQLVLAELGPDAGLIGAGLLGHGLLTAPPLAAAAAAS